MKQFFKFVFASMVGFILSAVVVFILLIAVITAVVSSSKEEVDIKENTVLHLNLNLPITERNSSNPLDNLDLGPFKGEKMLGLDEILKSIDHAKTDDRIKGIYLDASYLMTGFATMEEIRHALQEFRKSGKFVIAYSEVYTQGAYYLATAADKIYLNPQGALEFKGFGSTAMFFKGALDKLGIEAQIIKVGTYKSAVEPFIMEEMSPANRTQMTSILNSVYATFISNISSSRKISKDTLISIANELKCRNAQDAINFKLVDGIKYKDEVLDELKSKLGLGKKEEISTINITDYVKSVALKGPSKDRIAVIYANGEINSGEGDENTIGSEGVSRAIRKARTDDKVKAVVLRVNSPGGSSLASDVIWREVMLTKKVKPIYVSMGDYAASGGYYIACGADQIYAEPTTITGSIGVFAIIPNMKGFFNDKLGITFDNVKTGQYADLGNLTRPLSPSEKLIFQREVDKTYDDFTTKVAQGRKIEKSYVDSIGQGRVWTGEQAVKLKLVDKLGHLENAIQDVAKKAKLKDYRVVNYPEIDDDLFGFLNDSEDRIQTYIVKKELGESYSYYQQLKSVSKLRGVQALMPYTLKFE